MISQTLNGRFRLDGRLDHRGSGEIYRATDLTTGGRASVKILRSSPGGADARLKQEFRVLQHVRHPHIVAAIDAGETGEKLQYLATEFVEGPTLEEYVRDRGPLEARQVAQIAEQLAGALGAAHAYGLVHRDLSPANLALQTNAGGRESVKLLDFSRAKAIRIGSQASELEPRGDSPSNAAYISPEQAQGRPVAPQTDVYLLAATVYFALTGKPPFEMQNESAAEASTIAPPLAESYAGCRVPFAAEQVLRHALSKDPGDRPATPEDFARRFSAALGATPAPMLRGSPTAAVGGAAQTTQPKRKSNSAAAPSGRILNDRYRLEERLSQSPNGEVYKGSDLLTGKTVAVKVLRSRFLAGEQFGARLRREFAVLKKIEHPNVVHVLDAGQADEREHYLVMEYLVGRPLAQTVANQGPMQAEALAVLLGQVAAALDAAHSLGVLHRDVNPGNIMILDGAAPTAKLLDFGLAKFRQDDAPAEDLHMTGAGVILGNVTYMSPEQARGQKLTPSTDVYALAATMYFALTGEPPFSLPSEVEVMMAHVQQPPPPFATKKSRNSVPAAAEKVVLNAMAKSPADRPTSAGGFAARFCRAVGVPVPLNNAPAAKPVEPPAPAPRASRPWFARVAAGLALAAVIAWILLQLRG